jgi:tRNA threonylcarbamoyladenosine biosynthesis protein TsaB
MQILALETSTDACSLALYRNQEMLVSEAIMPQQHSHQLLPMLHQLLADAETTLTACDAIAFGRGPGSFTGVRIAASVAQGLAFGADLPVVPVSTLATVAWQMKQQSVEQAEQSIYIPTLDARMRELYWSVFREADFSDAKDQHFEQVTAFEMVHNQLKELSTEIPTAKLIVGGAGWHVYAPSDEQLNLPNVHCLTPVLPSAKAVAELAALRLQQPKATGIAPEFALPIYIRDNVAQIKK